MRVKQLAGAIVLSGLILAGCGGDDSSTTATDAGGATTAASGGAVTTAAAKDSGSAGDAFCVNGVKLASQFESATAKLGTTSGDMKTTYAQVNDFFKQLADKAPKEIKADFQTWAEGWSKFSAALAKYDYDFSKILQDPAAMQAMQALGEPKYEQASANIEAWLDKNCPGITK